MRNQQRRNLFGCVRSIQSFIVRHGIVTVSVPTEKETLNGIARDEGIVRNALELFDLRKIECYEARSQATVMEYRPKVEQSVFHYSKHCKSSIRPKYGAMNLAGTTRANHCARKFGTSFFVVKHELLPRLTFRYR